MICLSTLSLIGSSGIALRLDDRLSRATFAFEPVPILAARRPVGPGNETRNLRIGNRRHFRFGVDWVRGSHMDRQLAAQSSNGARIFDLPTFQNRAHAVRVELGSSS